MKCFPSLFLKTSLANLSPQNLSACVECCIPTAGPGSAVAGDPRGISVGTRHGVILEDRNDSRHRRPGKGSVGNGERRPLLLAVLLRGLHAG